VGYRAPEEISVVLLDWKSIVLKKIVNDVCKVIGGERPTPRCASPGPLELLGVVGCEADEDDQADAADDKLEHVGVKEDIDDGGMTIPTRPMKQNEPSEVR